MGSVGYLYSPRCSSSHADQPSAFGTTYAAKWSWSRASGLGPEQPWTTPERSWEEVLAEHSRDVREHQNMFQWRGAEAIRVIDLSRNVSS